MYRTSRSLAALAAAVALFAGACASQPPTGASTGAPERPGTTPTAAAAPAPTRPAAAPTTAAAPAPTTAAAPAPTTAAAPAPTTAAAAPTAAPAPTTPAAPAANPTAGRTKFSEGSCAACHGDKAQGGVFPGAPKLSGTALTVEQVRAQVRSPRDPSKGMPPFAAAAVSDQDINNIYAWLKTNP